MFCFSFNSSQYLWVEVDDTDLTADVGTTKGKIDRLDFSKLKTFELQGTPSRK